MADLTLSAALIKQLEETARRENRSVESLIASLLSEHETQQPSRDSTDRQNALRESRFRLYDVARRFWKKADDSHQYMTNDELEEQFWLFDQNGIPRLKSEQGTIDVPESPLQSILDSVNNNSAMSSIGEALHDTSARTREILRTEFVDHLLARMNRPAVPRDE